MISKLEPAKSLILSNREKYPLNFDEICLFLLETHGQPDIKNIIIKFTNDSLKSMLDDEYDLLTDRSMKSRITRLKKRFSNPQTIIESNDDSSCTEDL